MEQKLKIKTRKQLRAWFEKNHDVASCIWVKNNPGKPKSDKDLSNLNFVEECLCFGWIDGRKSKDNYVRLSPRSAKSHWTQLNIFRCKRLIKLGLMTKFGLKVMPKNKKFVMSQDIKKLLSSDKQLAKNFKTFPKLYQIIRLDQLQSYENVLPEQYAKAKNNFIKQTKNGKMYGQWNDYGRLA